MWVTVIQALANTVVVPLLGAIGAFYAVRASQKGSDNSAKLDKSATQLESVHALVDGTAAALAVKADDAQATILAQAKTIASANLEKGSP
jgi:hypothetical protein